MIWKENQSRPLVRTNAFLLLFLILILFQMSVCHSKIYQIKISQLSLDSSIGQPTINKDQLLMLINKNFSKFISSQSIYFQAPYNSTENSRNDQPIENKQPNGVQNRTQKSSIFKKKTKNESLTQKSSPQEKLVLVHEKQIKNRQFDGIGLYHNIPITFTKGQIFRFHGKVEKDISRDPFPSVHISFSEIRNSSSKFTCREHLKKGQTEFEFDCKMKISGRFYFTILAGISGPFRRKLRIIKEPRQPSYYRETPISPSMLQLKVINNDLFVEWESKSVLTKLRFFQKQKVIEYLLSNYHQRFKVPFYDFEEFETGKTTVEILHASSREEGFDDRSSNFSNPLSLTFEALEHKFSKMKPEAKNIAPIPWKVEENQSIMLKGFFTVSVKNVVFIVHPNLKIQKVPIISPIFKTMTARKKIAKQIQLKEPGVYLISVSHVSGESVINRPVYVGEGFPLIPDFQDLQTNPNRKQEKMKNQEEEKEIQFKKDKDEKQTGLLKNIQKKEIFPKKKESLSEPSSSASLQSKRQYMLFLLNKLRKKHKAPPVVFDDQLNKIAQGHTDDMIRRSFFAHKNPDGDDASRRAKKIGFVGSIGQNLALNTNLTNAHLSLERSPSHLKNSVDADWTIVGFGIGRNRNGLVLVTVLFSSRNIQRDPLSAQEIENYEKEIIRLILSLNHYVVTENKELSKDMKSWQNSDKNRETRLLDYLQKKQHFYGMSMRGITMNFSPNFIKRLRKQDNFFVHKNPSYTKAGLTIGQVNGRLQILLVFSG